MKTVWILIANASEARLFKYERGNQHHLELIKAFSHPESREKILNLVSDEAGRYRKSSRSPKSAFEEPFSPKQVEAQRFAQSLASLLEQGRNKNLFKDLILIAPSHFQGLLNKCFNAHIRNKITTTLDKDYTKVKEHDLPKYLNGKLTGNMLAA